eukprot:150262-Chlamydomonas_euryale.AAC.1
MEAGGTSRGAQPQQLVRRLRQGGRAEGAQPQQLVGRWRQRGRAGGHVRTGGMSCGVDWAGLRRQSGHGGWLGGGKGGSMEGRHKKCPRCGMRPTKKCP